MLEHLRGLREDKDWTQADMAKLLSIHQTTYSAYELETANIPVPVLRRLADYFNTSVDYLLDRTDEPTPYPPAKPR